MMKKLLILMLVLGMATAANAVVVQLGAGGATNGAGVDMETNLNVIEVVSDSDAVPYIVGVFAPDVSMLDITSIVARGGAGSDATVDDYGDAFGPGTHIYVISGLDLSPPLDSIVAGIQFDVQTTDGEGQIQLMNEGLDTVLDTMTVIPEPATMLLIGLGGLFLRRRS
jgi:hypothetical protein